MMRLSVLAALLGLLIVDPAHAAPSINYTLDPPSPNGLNGCYVT